GCGKELSFHIFPSDVETRSKWIVAFQREKESIPVRPQNRVCSQHFKKEDFREPGSDTAWRVLKKGIISLWKKRATVRSCRFYRRSCY
uniref:THAP-type domain-containing protein n=1 Tax=Erpetoichthys calabaricus TaxID=27687 RepID=A0A8C4SCU7_ERPCA